MSDSWSSASIVSVRPRFPTGSSVVHGSVRSCGENVLARLEGETVGACGGGVGPNENGCPLVDPSRRRDPPTRASGSVVVMADPSRRRDPPALASGSIVTLADPSRRGDSPALASGLVGKFKASSRPPTAADAIASAAIMDTRAASSDDAPPNLAVESEARVTSEWGSRDDVEAPVEAGHGTGDMAMAIEDDVVSASLI